MKIFQFCARSVALHRRSLRIVIENKSTSRSGPQEEGNSPRSITVSFSILFLYLSVKTNLFFLESIMLTGKWCRVGAAEDSPEQNKTLIVEWA